ncbi:NAD kinase [Blastomonas sp.]|uniref:NAD kinase n=1 Tax=Blastomonas sp. TaxID=1909299 RepID=UPI003593D0BE
MPIPIAEMKLALTVSPTEQARKASREMQAAHDWVSIDQADMVVVMGGDGFMLQTLHQMLERGRIVPVYGLNLGTVGFLMNLWRSGNSIHHRLEQAQQFEVLPLSMVATTMDGQRIVYPAINEVSLLRETRQTAKIEVSVNGAVRIPELVCDGVLVATPAGSTAYNLSASGPILPLGCGMLALTPISPFRPRRWKGALLPDSSQINLRVLEPTKRPVSAVADQREVRDIRDILIEIDPLRRLCLMFDPGHSLDDRISAEQFIV